MSKTTISKKRLKPKKLMNELRNKTILITGGAGSIGSALVKRLIEYPIQSVRILDIDENSLFNLNRDVDANSKLRLLLGSVLNQDRIDMASSGVDIIIHAAAIKNIEISEFNPMETIDVNIIGTLNMIKTCQKNKPKKFLNISTDKAVSSSTLYGTTKQITEQLTSWAGIHLEPIKFATARFGNVIETRGNVFEVWDRERKNNKPLSITHPSMKRYFFHIDEAVDFILECLTIMNQGEIFVPKMQYYSIKQMANKISKKQRIIGLRKGEKMEEILFTDEEKKLAKEKKNMWVIEPNS